MTTQILTDDVFESICGWCEDNSVQLTLDQVDSMASAIVTELVNRLAGVNMEPVAIFIGGACFGDELQDWEINPENGPCDKLNELYASLGEEVKLELYTLPNSQPGRCKRLLKTERPAQKFVKSVQKRPRKVTNASSVQN